jgi:hypothetical protein
MNKRSESIMYFMGGAMVKVSVDLIVSTMANYALGSPSKELNARANGPELS